ncbi:MAG: sugar ABC transporter ATP-binding protein [Planctomycetota bacterium]|jgi:ABC-type sugar transport system ATPase subunit|nr:sugar ABC transporter ATP-binding protein [Planctomycetota bacterium]
MAATEKLVMRGISKSFGNLRALNNLDFTLRRGEIHALMGENGAGKSTLMKILIGIHMADSGEIFLDGEPVVIASPREALARGIAMIHQELYPILDMSVADNLFLGREWKRNAMGPLSMVDRRKTRRETENLLAGFGIGISPDAAMRGLSVAETQLVEIVKAVSQGAEIIIMDEPTSAINEKEADRLFAHVERLKTSGASIIYISHKIDEIFKIAETVTVLRDGNFVASRPTREMTPELLVSQMVGREIDDIYPPPPPDRHIDGAVLEVSGLSDGYRFRNVSFQIRSGEILGMAGLMGSGRTEVAECVFGLTPKTSGETLLRGKPADVRSPRDAVLGGMALVSDDRKQKGLNLAATVGENISIVSLEECSRLGIIDRVRERAGVDEYMKRLAIKAESADTPAASLSGGNQQKTVLAKWLMAGPEVIIFDEPTRGIDVGAKREIYQLIRELAAQGKAILMISSEMGEIIGMSDRVIVMADGELAGTLDRSELTEEAIMTLAANLGPTGKGVR